MKFLNNLIATHKKCKVPVTISVLGSKYSDIYSPEAYTSMLRRYAPHKSLKRFLEKHTNHFLIDKDGNVTLIKKHTEKEDCGLDVVGYDSTTKSQISSPTLIGEDKVHQVSSTSTAVTVQPSHESTKRNTVFSTVHQASNGATAIKIIVVCFYYGTKKFPREITCADITSFKEQVHHILSTKLPNCKPVQVEYKFGDETFLLEDADSFEELLMGESLKVEIRAVPEKCGSDSTASNSNLTTSMQIKEGSSLINAKHSKTNDETFDHAENINKKNDLKGVIDSCINFLQRSLAILIRSVMMKIYGADQWLDQLKKAFPRENKKGPNKELQHISDSYIKSLPADELLKLTIRADERQDIFSKLHTCQCDFKELATNVSKIRNFYAHIKHYEEAALRFKDDYLQIERMSQEIVNWVEKEDCTSENIAIVNEDLQQIKLKYNGHKHRTAAKMREVVTALLGLNFNKYGYVLFSVLPHTFSIYNSMLTHLNAVSWFAVVDFDPHSKKNGGLLSAMCEYRDTNYWIKPKCIRPISYSDLDRIEKAELVKSSHIPWIFPHGDELDESNVSCPNPEDPEDLYTSVVQKPVFDTIRAFARSIIQQTSGMVSLVLCYGEFACSSSKLPYENFLDDFFVDLCSLLKLESRKVIVLTDSIQVELLLEKKCEIKVFNIPLTLFCQTLNDTLTKKDIPPVRIPHFHGLQEINFVEEDFTLVYEDIAKNEMLEAVYQKQTEIRQSADNSQIGAMPPKFDERHEIIRDFGMRFYKCETVSFVSLANDHAITRKEETKITEDLKELLLERKDRKTETAKYVLYHTAGAGATTLARKIVWQLRLEYPCVILKSNYRHSDEKIKETSRALKNLYKIVGMPILMLIDEEPTFQTVPQLTNRVQIDGIPMVFLHVQRYVGDEQANIETNDTNSRNCFYLPLRLSTEDAYNFQEKLCTVFDEAKISAGGKEIDEITVSMLTPNENDRVQDTLEGKARFGTISKICHRTGFYEAKVKWDNNPASCEWCIIGTSTNVKGKKRIYLTNINQKTSLLFQTFHIYGVMCLGEEFRKPMKEYIETRLSTISSLKEELRILAHLSILFAFKVIDAKVIHSRSFQQLCYKINPQTLKRNFDLKCFIPESAKEFALVDPLGWFRIINAIVADEILEFILSEINVSLSELVCEFLQCMLCDSEYPNKDVESAISSLLNKRETYFKDKFLAKKMFSNMILAVEDKEGEDAAIKVFQCALPLINNCHSYGHLARYLSKRVNDFNQALQYITNAEKLAYQDSEVAFVQNIKGDIHRDRLEYYINNKNPDWSNPGDNGYIYHKHACDAYQQSYKNSRIDYPLNGEIKVWLSLLRSVKHNYLCENPESDFRLSAVNITQVSKSVVRCSELFKKLDEFIVCGDGGKDHDSSNYKASATSLQVQFYEIIESDPERQKSILRSFIDDGNFTSESKVHNRRWYTRLFLPGQMPDYKYPLAKYKAQTSHSSSSQVDYNYLLKILEDNMRIAGYNDEDMQLWLLIVRKLPVGKNMEIIGHKLLEWNKKSKTPESKMWVNLYLSIFYFITLCEGNTTFPQMAAKFNTANKIVQEEGQQNKSRSRIKEWLQAEGKGFQCLRSDKQEPNRMLELEGKVMNILMKRPSISWKGIHVYFNPTYSSSDTFSEGQCVRFTVGFSLRGVRAITVKSIQASSVHSNSFKK